jgi:hypothetical protein
MKIQLILNGEYCSKLIQKASQATETINPRRWEATPQGTVLGGGREPGDLRAAWPPLWRPLRRRPPEGRGRGRGRGEREDGKVGAAEVRRCGRASRSGSGSGQEGRREERCRCFFFLRREKLEAESIFPSLDSDEKLNKRTKSAPGEISSKRSGLLDGRSDRGENLG